ncbi:WYL domain-containing protein [Pseudomonas fluorescens]|uniref:WYL domain-containing protein n=1 Tax=Pseudomonas fluorescens TaxID=294 RepID=UPI001CD70666
MIVLWDGEKRIRFAYRSGDGSATTREVTVYQVNSAGSGWNDDLYFYGLCHLRKEERTFRLDRVRYRNKVEDVATGEIGTLRQILSITERLER